MELRGHPAHTKIVAVIVAALLSGCSFGRGPEAAERSRPVTAAEVDLCTLDKRSGAARIGFEHATQIRLGLGKTIHDAQGTRKLEIDAGMLWLQSSCRLVFRDGASTVAALAADVSQF